MRCDARRDRAMFAYLDKFVGMPSSGYHRAPFQSPFPISVTVLQKSNPFGCLGRGGSKKRKCPSPLWCFFFCCKAVSG